MPAEIDLVDMERLLNSWGWRRKTSTSEGGTVGSGHRKWCWPLTNDCIVTSQTYVNHQTINQAATVMGITKPQFLEGPTARVMAKMVVEGKHVTDESSLRAIRVLLDLPGRFADQMEAEARSILARQQRPKPAVPDEVTREDLDRYLSAPPLWELDAAARRTQLSLRTKLREAGLLTDEIEAHKHARLADTASTLPAPRVPATVGASASASSRTTQEAPMASRSTAPPPGKATTIEEVMARSPRSTGKLGESRRAVLQALIEAGGSVEDRSGRATSILLDRMGNAGPGPRGLSDLLNKMDTDKQVGRSTNAKRTYSIYLLDQELAKGKGNGKKAETEAQGKAETEAAPVPETPVPAPAPESTVANGFAPEAAAEAEAEAEAETPAPTLPVQPEPVAAPAAVPAPAATQPAPAPQPERERTLTLSPRPGATPDPGTLLEVKFVDRRGRIFLETDGGDIAVAEGLRWV